jgi:nondiscriminating glutamyl-tRNA synthetase
VGGARTALFNWLFAKRHGGTFILRIEDTDQARSTPESEEMVLSDLRWLGLQWDEGPDLGGPHAPYRQSERREIYAKAAQQLISTRHAYRCFCTEETLEAKRKAAEESGQPPHYDLTCFRLDAAASELRATSEPFAIRFHVPKEDDATFDADVTIEDRIRGSVTWRKDSLGDFIVIRSDGMPTYNFSVVIDDNDMEITHVIRAEEHLTNTHRQVLLYRALGWKVPEFAHVSLILGSDRTKLSKRHGATSVGAYEEAGFLPEAMVNYLTLLGWSSPDGKEIFTAEESSSQFALDRINAAPAVFDTQKLEWMNGQYIQKLEPEEIARAVAPFLEKSGEVTDAKAAMEWIVTAVDMVKSGMHTFADITKLVQPVFAFDPNGWRNDPEAVEMMSDAKPVIDALASELEKHVPSNDVEYKAMAEAVKAASGAKGKKLFMPMRIALTGSAHGPELQKLLPLIHRASTQSGLAPVVAPLERAAQVLATLS